MSSLADENLRNVAYSINVANSEKAVARAKVTRARAAERQTPQTEEICDAKKNVTAVSPPEVHETERVSPQVAVVLSRTDFRRTQGFWVGQGKKLLQATGIRLLLQTPRRI